MKKFFVCFAVLTAMVLLVSCGGDSDNKSSEGSSVCHYGEYECHGNDSYFCGYSGDDLMWLHSESCPNGCNRTTGQCYTNSNNNENPGNESGNNGGDNNKQENACNNGDYRCSGAARLQCQNNSWEFAETCENSQCLEAQPDTCSDGSLKCSDDGSTVMICENNDWSEHETCSISCNSEKNKCMECSSGDKCSGDMLLTCSDGEWTFKETCSLGCSNDKCNVCTPNCLNKQCGLDGCGGTCGSCDGGYDCTATSQCVKNNSCSEHNDCSGDDICYKNFCQSPWNKKWEITFKDAKVSEKDKNNESWDALGGLPDLFSIVFVNDNQCYRTTTKQDSTTAVWNESTTLDFAASTDTIKLCLYDEDFTSSITGNTVDSNDLVGCLTFDSSLFRKFDETNKFFTFSTSSDLLQYWRIAFEPAW